MRHPPLLPAFLRYTQRHGLIPAGSRVIAAVSGGADSTCLLHLLLEAREQLDLRVEIAHFNHHLRGRPADRDAAAVAATARRFGLDCHLGQGRPFTSDERRGASVQELARGLRLGFLLALARRRRAIVALGHTADDQAETLLMRFLSGTGPAGLGGIPPASHGGRLVHPLLFARRIAIESWLGERAVAWRTDRTNRSPRYLRNRVRRNLLPLLTRIYNPRLVEHLGALAEALRHDHDFLEATAAELRERAATGPDRYTFAAAVLASAPSALLARAVLAALRALARRPADFSSRHLAALLNPSPGARSWDLPGGITASRDGGGLVLAKEPRRPAAALRQTPLPIPGRAVLTGGAAVSARTAACPPGFDPRRFGADPRRVALDRAAVKPPLFVRSRAPGDRFQPFGLPGSKKLKDFLIGAGIPAAARARLPLVCDRQGICWVAGVRPAERCRVHAGTRRLLVLELQEPTETAE